MARRNQRLAPSRKPYISERRQKHLRFQRQREAEIARAGDERVPPGATTEERKAYPKLLRDPYEFGPSPLELTDEEVIAESGCRQVVEEV